MFFYRNPDLYEDMEVDHKIPQPKKWKVMRLKDMQTIAADPKTDPKDLDYLSYESYSTVRKLVARNENTPYSTLKRLAMDPASDVITAVAKNQKSGPDILSIIATNVWSFVRNSVLENPNCTDLIKHLVYMQKGYVFSWEDPLEPLKPSEVFNGYEYQKFIDVATIKELESDLIIELKTLVSVISNTDQLTP